jgi:hypothetical protein
MNSHQPYVRVGSVYDPSRKEIGATGTKHRTRPCWRFLHGQEIRERCWWCSGGTAGSFSYSCSDEVSSQSGNTPCSSRITCEPRSPPCASPRVHFNAAVSQRLPVLIPCINEYSPREEIERSWCLPEESFKIHQRCIKEITMFETGKRLKGKKYCSRGLENSTVRAQLASSIFDRSSTELRPTSVELCLSWTR